MRSNLTSYRMNAFLYIIAVVVGRMKLQSEIKVMKYDRQYYSALD